MYKKEFFSDLMILVGHSEVPFFNERVLKGSGKLEPILKFLFYEKKKNSAMEKIAVNKFSTYFFHFTEIFFS